MYTTLDLDRSKGQYGFAIPLLTYHSLQTDIAMSGI